MVPRARMQQRGRHGSWPSLQIVCIILLAPSRMARTFAPALNTCISIPRSILTFVVALMYLCTSTTAIAHGLSHAPLDGACDRAAMIGAADVTIDVLAPEIVSDHDDAVERSISQECFFCHQGPAVAVASVPRALASPSMTPSSIVTVLSADAISALRVYVPSLRAPPTRS